MYWYLTKNGVILTHILKYRNILIVLRAVTLRLLLRQALGKKCGQPGVCFV